jgi:hypothetical protein
MLTRSSRAAALWLSLPLALATAQHSSTLHFADVDGDGLDDALVIGPAGEVSLLVGRGEGRFEDVTAASGLGEVEFASCALFADFDGDGRVDLFVGSSEQRLWRNDGKGVFAALPSGIEHDLVDLEAHALDHDRDGRLDLVLHTDAGDLLYRNAPSGRFERVELLESDHRARVLAVDGGDDASSDSASTSSDASSLVSAARKRHRRWLQLRAARTSTASGSSTSNLAATPNINAASTGPLGLAGTPSMICAGTIVDQASGMCIEASSIGVGGSLYPLSNDFFVDSANSRVGVGTTTPLYTLHVAGKFVSGVNTSATGANAAVGGGASNSASGAHSAVAGGESNTAGHSHGFIGGGLFNSTLGTRSVIGGGISNRAGNSAVVGGGSNNEANFNFSTVGGGRLNVADATYAAIVGGASNSATGQYSFIGGGGEDNVPASANVASGLASSIVGGRANTASGDRAAIGGGSSNQATSQHTAIAGGRANSAFGAYGAIPGGELNVAAGSHSLAAGRRAKAVHDGAFVWGDSTNADFSSTAPNQFLIRAAGGVGIGRTPDPAMKLDVNGAIRASDTIVSSKASGAPLAVASTDLNTNLNADFLDGFHASAFRMLGSQIETAEIADSAVTSNKIASGAVGASTLSANAVTSSKLIDGAVTSTKIAAGAVDAAAIAVGSVSPDKLDASGGVVSQVLGHNGTAAAWMALPSSAWTPITALPFVITQPGAYYLAGNLTGVAGAHGIDIQSSYVSLDLNGFVLSGVLGSLDGIRVTGPRIGVRVFNGAVTAWGQSGVTLGLRSCVSDVFASSNGSTGIRVSTSGSISQCHAYQNGGDGISAGARSTVVETQSGFNTGDGFDVQGGLINRCTSDENGGAGIRGGASLIENCYVLAGQAGGIVSSAGVVRGNSVSSCVNGGIVASSDCHIESNVVANATGGGVVVTGIRNVIDGNSVESSSPSFQITGTANLLTRNRCTNGGANPYLIVAGNDYGVIVNPTAGFSSSEPFANFSY